MKEKEIEMKLAKAVKHMGGICPKLVSPGYDGMPDRMVLLPHGRMGFVELKAPEKKPRPLQEARIRTLRGLGYMVFVVDDEKKIEEVISAIEGGEME